MTVMVTSIFCHLFRQSLFPVWFIYRINLLWFSHNVIIQVFRMRKDAFSCKSSLSLTMECVFGCFHKNEIVSSPCQGGFDRRLIFGMFQNSSSNRLNWNTTNGNARLHWNNNIRGLFHWKWNVFAYMSRLQHISFFGSCELAGHKTSANSASLWLRSHNY